MEHSGVTGFLSSAHGTDRTIAACRRAWRILLLALVSVTGLHAGAVNPEASSKPLLLTKAAQIHDLPADLAADTPVHLVATVTYYDPADGVLFVQDDTGGVYVNTNRDYPVKQGDLVSIVGRSHPSYRTEVAMDPDMRVLGRGQTFAGQPLTYGDLVAGRGDCKVVTVHGRVLAADVEQHEKAPTVHLDIGMAGGEVQVYLGTSTNFHPETLLDATVEVTGVQGGAFDNKNQLTGIILYSPKAGMIRVLQAPPTSARQLPLTEISNVFETRNVTDASARVRVRGTLTYYKAGDSAVVENAGHSIFVQTRQTSDLTIGDMVDVFGFASDREYSPSLRNASILKAGGTETIAPRPLTFAEAFSGVYADDLVAMNGTVVSELHDPRGDTLVLDVDGHLVNGYLEGKGVLPGFQVGSRVRMVGICRIVPGGPWRAPYQFSLKMRTAEDAQLVSKPSWWTKKHLVQLLEVLILLALAVTAWAVILRRRVIQQTARIERSMIMARERSRILEKISSNQAPDVLLSEICASVMSLLPGVSCSYHLHSGRQTETPPRNAEYVLLYEVTLTGVNDEACGSVFVRAARGCAIRPDQQEVYATLSELATLAMRQSLLHQSLVHHSTHDPLTELPNRRLCEIRLAHELEQADKHGTRLAVIYIDVNRFKHVNDQYGHKAGDAYLRQISGRLHAQVRSTDMLARIGGDEFLVIAPLTTSQENEETLTGRLKACFDDPFHLEGHTIEGSASFGLARFPQDGSTAEELQRKADQAMYLFKRSLTAGTDLAHGISIISPAELENALDRDLFRLLYQPQFSAEGRLTGLEALLRLEDPILGSLSPDAFISVAERHDVIFAMGAWSLNRALQDAIGWDLHTGEHMVIVVNVSAREMNEPGFAEGVLATLEQTGFPPKRLELELTERSLVSDSDSAARQLRRLRQAGVRISLDDFGSGPSSLSQLHKLPVDTIKLDRSFIVAMDDEPAVIPIIQAISYMARRLGKRIVAEGIEHVGPVPALLKMGRIEFQGYLLSRPLAFEDVDQKIQTWRKGVVMPLAFRESSNQALE